MALAVVIWWVVSFSLLDASIRQWAGPSNSGWMASITVDYLTIYCERV